MKNLFYFNLSIYLSVILLHFIQPIYGALSQIVLGFVQVIMIIVLMADYSKYSKLIKKTIKGYWILIATWLFVFVTIKNIYDYNKADKMFVLVIPMLIGLYSVIMTFIIQKKLKNKKL